MLSQNTKQFSVMVPKQTIGCFHKSIGCFGFDSKSTIKTVPSRHRALTEGQSQRMMGAPRGKQGREVSR